MECRVAASLAGLAGWEARERRRQAWRNCWAKVLKLAYAVEVGWSQATHSKRWPGRAASGKKRKAAKRLPNSIAGSPSSLIGCSAGAPGRSVFLRSENCCWSACSVLLLVYHIHGGWLASACDPVVRFMYMHGTRPAARPMRLWLQRAICHDAVHVESCHSLHVTERMDAGREGTEGGKWGTKANSAHRSDDHAQLRPIAER